ncbi:iron-containing alcohol dehydrogenase family protein [Clostridium sp. DL1XJH146]
MKDFNYLMPTKVLFGKDVLEKHKDLIKKIGGKCLIVTGKSSSKKNGSLHDVEKILSELRIKYSIFDEIEENPTIELVEKGGLFARNEKSDFIIAIGGGSPLDAAKGIGVFAYNKDFQKENLFDQPLRKSIPIIAIPTTSGTGSEVTPYAIYTDHIAKTKRNFSHKIFPEIAFLDAKYTETVPYGVTVNTAVDAFSHLIEGYLNVNANTLSDASAEKGIKLFGECMNALYNKEIDYEIREKLLLMSTLGGIVIAQCGTSLPHGMGYHLTYYHHISHGKANGLLLPAYMKLCEKSNKDKVDRIIELLGIESIKEFSDFIKITLGDEFKLSEEEITTYSALMIGNEAKLKNHPEKVEVNDIEMIYKDFLGE